jgi:hypothetical protein
MSCGSSSLWATVETGIVADPAGLAQADTGSSRNAARHMPSTPQGRGEKNKEQRGILPIIDPVSSANRGSCLLAAARLASRCSLYAGREVPTAKACLASIGVQPSEEG